jgi:hypothetical protein
MTAHHTRLTALAVSLLAVLFTACGGSAPAASAAVQVVPAAVVTAPGATVPFSAQIEGAPVASVAWAVQEANGGSVDASGNYTAPPVPGVFHVTASSTVDPLLSASATVTVTPTSPVTPPVTPPVAPTGASSLGVNLAAVNDWDPAQPFADAMKGARHFGSVGQPSDEAAPVDAAGWPTGDAGVVVMVGVPHMAGTYRLTFTGSASVGVNAAWDASTHVAGASYDAASNTTSADVVVGAAEQNLFLTFTGQAGGVKAVKLMRPGHGPTELFSQPFLARLASFRVLRLMDFLHTNGNTQTNWTDRSLPGSASQQVRPTGPSSSSTATVGVAWEYVVLLANQAGKDIWINLPHQATDDYVTRLAQLLRYGSDGVNPYTSPQANPVFPPLDPSHKVYVEWSNELWNGGFAQSTWLGARADAAVAAGDPDLLYDGNTNHYSIMFRLVGRRSMEVSNLFRAVFGDADMLTRIRPVLPGQIANSGTISEPLAYLAARHGGAARYFYAAAGAPYVTVNNDDAGTRAGLTLDTIFSEMTSYAEVNVHTWMKAFSKLASDNGLKMVAYEGGQHLYGTGSTDAKVAAQLDPRMKDVLLLNYANWYASGGDLFVYYTLCSSWDRYGSWGLSPDITSEAGPKWDAIRQLAASAP